MINLYIFGTLFIKTWKKNLDKKYSGIDRQRFGFCNAKTWHNLIFNRNAPYTMTIVYGAFLLKIRTINNK